MTEHIPWRTPCQGLAQIFNYNRPLYLRTAAAIMLAIVVSIYAPPSIRVLIALATAIAVFWTCSSLLVSHYVYDRSGLYNFCWLPGCLSRSPERWVNIHAGLDESSLALKSMFFASEGQAVDIYDGRKMTEPSIRRARLLAGVSVAASGGEQLRARDDTFDAAFLIFVAHELRHDEDRVRLCQEIRRVLRGGGELILVEHLRGWANFLAFGPGFFHFFSKRTWGAAASSAGLRMRLHTTVTPFVHVFVFQKQQ